MLTDLIFISKQNYVSYLSRLELCGLSLLCSSFEHKHVLFINNNLFILFNNLTLLLKLFVVKGYTNRVGCVLILYIITCTPYTLAYSKNNLQ